MAAMITSLSTLQYEVVEWADQIAPSRQPKDTVVKIVSETSELLDAVLNKDPAAVKEEIGDLMILLVDIANMYGIDPTIAGLDKMEINKSRQWEIKDGVMRRIR